MVRRQEASHKEGALPWPGWEGQIPNSQAAVHCCTAALLYCSTAVLQQGCTVQYTLLGRAGAGQGRGEGTSAWGWWESGLRGRPCLPGQG